MSLELSSQLRLGLRRLIRRPIFTITCVGTLALGIGANVATFSVVNGVLLQPLAFEDADDLVGVWHRAPGITPDRVNLSQAMYFTYKENSRTLEDIGLWSARQVVLSGIDEPEQMPAIVVTRSLLSLLRLRPALGRLFSAEDDSPGAADTTILSYDLWQRRFAGEASVIGQTLRIDGQPRQVIGVLPADFELPLGKPQVLLPAKLDRSRIDNRNYDSQAIARLRPGTSLETVNADINRMLILSTELFPGSMSVAALEEMRWAADVTTLKSDAVGDSGSILWILLGTAGLVLLIACANVANLFLVRAESRNQEIALRSALGARRLQIAQLFLSESLGISLLAGSLGLILAFSGLKVLLRLGPQNLPRLQETGINGTVVLFALGISILTGVVLGLFPTLRLSRVDLIGSLKEGGRGAMGESRHRARSALVVIQIAMTLVLLVASGLMIRSFQELRQVDPGFGDPEEVITFRVSTPNAEIQNNLEAALVYERIQKQLAELPGVTSVGASSPLTMDPQFSADVFWVEDHPLQPGEIPPLRRVKRITPGYFATLATPVLAGRDLSWADIHDLTDAAMVSANFAQEYWGGPNQAIGKRISIANPSGFHWREIVGVVGNTRDDGLNREPTSTVYWPLAGNNNRQLDGTFVPRLLAFALRSERRDPTSLVPEARNVVRQVNSNLPIANVQTLQDILNDTLAPTSFTLTMLLVASAIALLLGMVGVYSVMSYIVTQRRREIGVRMAFGADARSILTMVGRQGLTLALIGIAVGLLAAFGMTRLMTALLFGVAATDPATYSIVALLLVAMVLIACYFPARRASRTNPVQALHGE